MERSSRLPLLRPGRRAIWNYVPNYCLIFFGFVIFIVLMPNYSAALRSMATLAHIAMICIIFEGRASGAGLMPKLFRNQILLGAWAFVIAFFLLFYISSFRDIAIEPFDAPLSQISRNNIKYGIDLHRPIPIDDYLTTDKIFFGILMEPVTVQTTLWLFTLRVMFIPNLTLQAFVFAFMSTAFGFNIGKYSTFFGVPRSITVIEAPAPILLLLSFISVMFAYLLHLATTGIIGVAMAKKVFLGRSLVTVVTHWLSAVLLHVVYNVLTVMPVIFAINGMVSRWCLYLPITAQAIIILTVLFLLRAQVQGIANQIV